MPKLTHVPYLLAVLITVAAGCGGKDCPQAPVILQVPCDKDCCE